MIRAQGGGKIINICSMMSELGRETVSAYAAAKGGLKMLTKNIALSTAHTTSSATAVDPAHRYSADRTSARDPADGSRHPLRPVHRCQDPAGPLGARQRIHDLLSSLASGLLTLSMA